jgi:predicted ABC-type exoprotein transport system permease subunit
MKKTKKKEKEEVKLESYLDSIVRFTEFEDYEQGRTPNYIWFRQFLKQTLSKDLQMLRSFDV